MRIFLTLIFVLVFSQCTLAQRSPLVKEIIVLINESRTNPKGFLEKHKDEIVKYQPRYIGILEKCKPIPAVIWDKGLEAMAKSAIDQENLNPKYQGENKLCGFSSGTRRGTYAVKPIEFVCDVYTNINDKSYKYIGIYYNKDNNNGLNFQWGKSCEREKIEFSFTENIDSAGIDFNALNTAKNSTYMNEAEQQMVMELNYVRKHPKIYAKIIAKYLSDRSSSIWGLDYDTYYAGLELIEELNELEPLNILEPKECVFNAAKKHGLDCQNRGFFDHTGSDKSAPWDRITDACEDFSFGNENGAGGSEDPRKTVISLLLDDGISSRGHRYNILDKRWKFVGCFRYASPKYGYQWVQNFGY